MYVEGRGRLPALVWPKPLKRVVVYSSDVPHQLTAQQQVGPVSVYYAGWGVMSFVCGLAFLCHIELVKKPMLQAGTTAIWPQMFKSNVKPQQTNMNSGYVWRHLLSFLFIINGRLDTKNDNMLSLCMIEARLCLIENSWNSRI